jgi:hypothetical protein
MLDSISIRKLVFPESPSQDSARPVRRVIQFCNRVVRRITPLVVPESKFGSYVPELLQCRFLSSGKDSFIAVKIDSQQERKNVSFSTVQLILHLVDVSLQLYQATIEPVHQIRGSS